MNNAKQSIIFIACWNNSEPCVKMLLENNVDVNASDQRGWTPLIISVYHNYTTIVEILLEAGADWNHRDCFGKQAIDRAKTPEMIALLQNSITERRIANTN